ncbi:hypothetical protein BV898_14848 [Hypsibius exemplaris]|uniref:Uncharacterized protein n=1 Tax=Hypsibius exemplaris TaxID=2072580 RepID=A0A9X6N9H8_HYPEX|nr:hypothetical protein BV898_14848 [Hypsibius exemplaris]
MGKWAKIPEGLRTIGKVDGQAGRDHRNGGRSERKVYGPLEKWTVKPEGLRKGRKVDANSGRLANHPDGGPSTEKLVGLWMR